MIADMTGESEVLTRLQLNRTLLSRQLLLSRDECDVVDAVRRLGGLQAQDARPPFIALWTRLAGFVADDLTRALHAKAVVRATAMRGTLHVVETGDYRAIRPTTQEISWRAMRLAGPREGEVDMASLLIAGRAFFAGQPRTMTELRKELMRAFPDADESRLTRAVRYLIELVVIPTTDRWAFPGNPRFALAEDWLGAPVLADPDPELVVRRYLAAFGPATVADAQTWSGLQGLRAVVDRMRPTLRGYRDERGRELLDVEAGVIQPEDVPAPVRFLAGFDNLLLSHDDRSRVMSDAARTVVFASKNGRFEPTFLVDGVVAGTWSTGLDRGVARLEIAPFTRMPKGVRTAVVAEAEALLAFLEPDAGSRAVTFVDP